jgi:hypothetical protein
MQKPRLSRSRFDDLIEAEIIDGREHVRKPRLRPWQVSVSAKPDAELPKPPETCWTQIATFGRIPQKF